ncbi:hypothetical protein [Amycolatopsis sp. NPDC051371]|uniref:hypothetical protein n=1 Tax=Amycolatopsis sp. NPDC051371 TaxID=3155800 RepID=UPI0034461A71
MPTQFSVDVRALFADLGIETEKVVAIKSDLVIDRFDRPAAAAPVRDSIGLTFADSPYGIELAA